MHEKRRHNQYHINTLYVNKKLIIIFFARRKNYYLCKIKIIIINF